jgi:hypothetical protein
MLQGAASPAQHHDHLVEGPPDTASSAFQQYLTADQASDER